MSRLPELSNGNRIAQAMKIEGRIFEGHTSAYTAAAMTTATTLTAESPRFLKYTPNGDYNLTLPAEADSAGLAFTITNVNPAGNNVITVKDDGGNTIVAIDDLEQSTVVCDGTTWIHMGIITVAAS